AHQGVQVEQPLRIDDGELDRAALEHGQRNAALGPGLREVRRRMVLEVAREPQAGELERGVTHAVGLAAIEEVLHLAQPNLLTEREEGADSRDDREHEHGRDEGETFLSARRLHWPTGKMRVMRPTPVISMANSTASGMLLLSSLVGQRSDQLPFGV